MTLRQTQLSAPVLLGRACIFLILPLLYMLTFIPAGELPPPSPLSPCRQLNREWNLMGRWSVPMGPTTTSSRTLWHWSWGEAGRRPLNHTQEFVLAVIISGYHRTWTALFSQEWLSQYNITSNLFHCVQFFSSNFYTRYSANWFKKKIKLGWHVSKLRRLFGA